MLEVLYHFFVFIVIEFVNTFKEWAYNNAALFRTRACDRSARYFYYLITRGRVEYRER